MASHDASQPLGTDDAPGRRDGQPGSQETCPGQPIESLEERVAFMSPRVSFAFCAPVALCALLLLALLPAAAGAKTVRAELRVLTPDRVLDPGTSYIVGPETVRTDPPPTAISAAPAAAAPSFEFPKPNAVSLLAAAAGADPAVRPLSVSDEFGFGLAMCAVGGVDDQPGTFWYVKRNHTELTVGVDQEPISNGDQLLVYLAPDNFPAPNPAELELRAPARAKPGEPFSVSVTSHSCVTDPNPPFATSCEAVPAPGATISGANGTLTTADDGTAQLVAQAAGDLRLTAVRGTDIRSQTLRVCVDPQPSGCPSKRGKKILGRDADDRIKGTGGADTIRGPRRRDRVLARGARPTASTAAPVATRCSPIGTTRSRRTARRVRR